MRGQIKEWWGKLTDEDLEQAAGKFDVLAGLRQRREAKLKKSAFLTP